jgi:maltose O-acetyltransferase
MLAVRDLLDELVARHRLARCDLVGTSVRAVGAPSVANDGRIEISGDVVISSVPLPTHFATAPGSLLRIGSGVRIAHGVGIYTSGEVVIGDDTTIGALVLILDLDVPRARGQGNVPRSVRIGRDVNLGSGVVVIRGAVIGDGVRVAPNSLVNGTIAPGLSVGGVPAEPLGRGVAC